MKRILFYLFLAISLMATPATGAVFYVDYTNGDDGTGDGSYSTPWKTLDKCTDPGGATTGGDECRVAKTAMTALSGTLTFTNGSTTVSTSADLTGELSAGDIIGKNTAIEGWWSVSSLTSSAITLSYPYWGTSATTTAYTPTFFTNSSVNDGAINASGTSAASRLKISGGWDLSTQTQDGITAITGTSSLVYASNANKDFVEISNFLYDCQENSTLTAQYKYFRYGLVKNIWMVEPNAPKFADFATVENLVCSGGTNNHISQDYEGNPVSYKNIYSYSAGTGVGDYGFALAYSVALVDGLYIYNAYHANLKIDSKGVLIGSNVVLDTNRYLGSGDCIYLDSGAVVKINNVDFANAEDNGVQCGTNVGTGSIIYNATFSSIGGSDILCQSTGWYSFHPVIKVINYDDVANDDRMFFQATDLGMADVAEITRDTTDARSGSCLKFTVGDDDYPIFYTLGTYQVASTASDITLAIYLKDNASFNGTVFLWAEQNGAVVGFPAVKTMTTSYAQYSVVVSAADLVLNEYLTLGITVTGTAGNVFADDFSAN